MSTHGFECQRFRWNPVHNVAQGGHASSVCRCGFHEREEKKHGCHVAPDSDEREGFLTAASAFLLESKKATGKDCETPGPPTKSIMTVEVLKTLNRASHLYARTETCPATKTMEGRKQRSNMTVFLTLRMLLQRMFKRRGCGH
eukprot:6050125-Amphidinium_carterae.2